MTDRESSSPSVLQISKYLKFARQYHGKTDCLSKHLCGQLGVDDDDPDFNETDEHKNQRQNSLQIIISQKKSTELRNEGNTSFDNKDYKKAQLLYTKSIAAAINSGPSEELALAFANRSAALFCMNMYEDCLKDIERALVHGYTENMRYKLYLRKARCLMFLGRDSWDASLKKALRNIHYFHDQGEIIQQLTVSVLREFQQAAPHFDTELPKANSWTLPSFRHNGIAISSEVPSFSSAVKVDYSKELGRHLVATQNIRTGDVLIIEESIVSTLAPDNPEEQWNICHKCYKHSLSLIPCKSCGHVMYCGEKCRKSDWKGNHKGACPLTKCIFSGEMAASAHLLFSEDDFKKDKLDEIIDRLQPFNCLIHQLICHFGMNELKYFAINSQTSTKEHYSNPRARGFKDGKFSLSLEAFFSLEDNEEKLSPDEKLIFCLWAHSLAAVYRIPEDELIPMTAIFMKMTMIFRFNCKYMSVFNVNYYEAGWTDQKSDLGIAMYLASSLINHSCHPNAYMVSYGSTAVYRAMRPIKKGEQITESYHVSVMNAGFLERQSHCQNASKVECRCEACENMWPTYAEMPNLLETSVAIKKMIGASGFDVSDPKEIEKLLIYLKNFKAADTECLPKMVLLLENLHGRNMRFNKWYFQLQECIKNHYRVQGNANFFGDTKEIYLGEKPFDVDEFDIFDGKVLGLLCFLILLLAGIFIAALWFLYTYLMY